MFGRKILMVGTSLALLSEVSCSRPLCEVDSEDTRCPQNSSDGGQTNTVLSIAPKRVSLATGETLHVSVSDLLAKDTVQSLALIQSSSGHNFTISNNDLTVQDGLITVNLTIEVLSGFKPGLVTISLNRPNKPVATAQFRLFMLPSYSAIKQTANAGNTPIATRVWNDAAIGSSVQPFLVVLNKFAGSQENIRTYNYDTQNGPYFASVYPTNMDSNFNTETALGLSAAEFVIPILDTSNNKYYFYGCPLPTPGPCSKIITGIAATKISSIAIDKNDSIFAFAIDGSLSAYYRDAASANALKPLIPNKPPTSVNWVEVGFFDDDAQSDVVTFQKAGDVSVFVRTSISNLQLSSDLTSSFKSSLGLPGTNGITSIGVGDADGDGLSDLVIGRTAQLEVFVNQGDGTFQKAYNRVFTTMSGTTPLIDSVTLGDIDGDAKSDLILSIGNIQGVVVLANQAK